MSRWTPNERRNAYFLTKDALAGTSRLSGCTRAMWMDMLVSMGKDTSERGSGRTCDMLCVVNVSACE